MRSIYVLLLTAGIVSAACAQTETKPKTLPPGVPAAPHVVAGQEKISGRTYSNPALGFEVTFPEGWVISGDDFETEAKKAGIDLGLKAPENIGQVSRVRMDKSLKNVSMLVTAYRPAVAPSKGAIIRISLENLSPNPQIKDAIDYFDAIRNEYAKMSLPADFRYSETQAEQLGKQQFAFLDLSSSAGKKRLYATVRRGYAVMFSLSYTRDEDLQAMRRMLSIGNFSLK
jgi:hypothetical protein